MPLRDAEICYGDCRPDQPYSPAIKIWIKGELVISADELTVELKNNILDIKGDVIEIKNKNKNKLESL